MSARRIARELAVIVLPQISKKTNFEELDLNSLIAKTVGMLCDYAKQNLAEADSLLNQASGNLVDIEIEHPSNEYQVQDTAPVALTTAQLQQQLVNLNRAVKLIAEALDMPAISLQKGAMQQEFKCSACGHFNEITYYPQLESDIRQFLKQLLSAYWTHRSEIDQFIKHAKSKWQVERMVSIDRDILRLACAEAFYLPDVPISVCISEAVELGHRFADERAAKFINGVLGDLSAEARFFRNKGKFPERTAEDELPNAAHELTTEQD